MQTICTKSLFWRDQIFMQKPDVEFNSKWSNIASFLSSTEDLRINFKKSD